VKRIARAPRAGLESGVIKSASRAAGDWSASVPLANAALGR